MYSFPIAAAPIYISTNILRCVFSCSVASVVSDSLQPRGLEPTSLFCPRDSPGKNTGVGCHFLLQGIFLIQRSNPHLLCLLHWQADSLPLHYLGFPSLYTLINTCHLYSFLMIAVLTSMTWYVIVVLICILLWSVMLSIFSHACLHLYVFFGENVYPGFCPLFNQARFYFVVVIELYELFIFYISPLSIRAFANIFSHSVDCLFALSMDSFAVQKLFFFLRSF